MEFYHILMWQWEVAWTRVDDLDGAFHFFILCFKEAKWEVKRSPQQPMLRWGTAFVSIIMFKASSGRAGTAPSAVTICSASSFASVNKAKHGKFLQSYAVFPIFRSAFPHSVTKFKFFTFFQVFLIFTINGFFSIFSCLTTPTMLPIFPARALFLNGEYFCHFCLSSVLF